MRKNPTMLAGSGLPRKALPEVDSAGFVIGSPERDGECGLIDGDGNLLPRDQQILPPPTVVQPIDEEFIGRLRAWVKSTYSGIRNYAYGNVSDAIEKEVSGIVDALRGKRRRGRPPKPQGPQTDVQRKQKQRGFEKDFVWVAEQLFPVVAGDNYLVIDTTHDDELPLFDQSRATVISGAALRAEMATHHKTYPDGSLSYDGSLVPVGTVWPKDRPAPLTESRNDFKDGMKALVLVYPEHVRYFIPDIRIPASEDDVLCGKGGWSLNNGMFLREAPAGCGRLVSGWGHREGVRAEDESDLEDVSDKAQTGLSHSDPLGGHDGNGDGQDYTYDSAVGPASTGTWRQTDAASSGWYDEDDRDEDPETGEPIDIEDRPLVCNLCQAILSFEDDYDLAIKHLSEYHPKEYRQVRRETAEWLQKKQKAEKQRKLRLENKQKHCREDHDAMFARRLEANDNRPAWWTCECGASLCKSRHTKMVEEELAKRTAYRANLPYQEYQDASKAKSKPIYCRFCHAPILVTEYEIRDRHQ